MRRSCAVAILALLLAGCRLAGAGQTSSGFPSPEPSPARTAFPTPSPTPAATREPSPTPVPFGGQLTDTCRDVAPDWDHDPSRVIVVQFVDSAFPERPDRDRFARSFGLEEFRITLIGDRAWFSYVIVDGSPRDVKIEAVRASPLVEDAYAREEGGGELGAGPEIILAAVTPPPEYDPDAVIPEVLIRFTSEMTAHQLEVFSVKWFLTYVGAEADGWHRFCTYDIMEPAYRANVLRQDPLVADVGHEVP